MLKILSITVLAVVGLVLYTAMWTVAFDLLNAPNTLLVIFGFVIIGTLLGAAIYSIVLGIKKLKTLLDEEF